MRIFLFFIVSECLEAPFEVCAHRWWDIVVDARLIRLVLVIVIVREVCDFARTLNGGRRAAKAIERLY
jgi:hypothetical protein